MASDNLVQLLVDVGTLAPKPVGESRQQYAEELAKRLLVYLPTTITTFNIGGAMPTSDDGPWFKEVTDPKSGDSGYELWVWSATAATYVPLTLNQIQLRYFVGVAAPSEGVYDVWFKTNSAGKPLGVHTYNSTTAAWEPNSYTPDEIDALFEPTVAGKKQIEWDNVLNAPASAGFNPRSVSGILSTSQNGTGSPVVTTGWNYEWEQVYHTGIGQMIIFDPIATIWKTLSGGVGDIKMTNGTLIGTNADFAAGTFGTILGKNPGWDEETVAAGRTLVGAKPSEVWDDTTVLTKDPGSTYGADTLYLTKGQLPPHIHPMDKYFSDNYSSSQGTNIEGAPGTEKGLLDTGSTGDGDAISLHQKSIAYHVIRKIQ